MKTDKELLMMAAKAVGVKITEHIGALCDYIKNDLTGEEWNPLTDDGCALRLAVDLDMGTFFYDNVVKVFFKANGITDFVVEPYGSDKHAATRRAIVRAAAAIGEQME